MHRCPHVVKADSLYRLCLTILRDVCAEILGILVLQAVLIIIEEEVFRIRPLFHFGCLGLRVGYHDGLARVFPVIGFGVYRKRIVLDYGSRYGFRPCLP